MNARARAGRASVRAGQLSSRQAPWEKPTGTIRRASTAWVRSSQTASSAASAEPSLGWLSVKGARNPRGYQVLSAAWGATQATRLS